MCFTTVTAEQTPGSQGKMNNNQHSIKEEQREPERIDGGTPNEGRSEEINRQGRGK